MTKVLHLRSSGSFLGAERVVIELSKRLPSLGYEPVIGVPLEKNSEVPELYHFAKDLGIQAELFYCRHPYDLGIMKKIRQFVIDEKIQIIHSHGYREDLYALGSKKQASLVATNHLWKRTDLKLKLYAAIDGYLLRRFQAVVAVSQPIVLDLKNAGVNPNRTLLIPNGIDTEKFSGNPNRHLLRSEFCFNDNQVILLTVSSLSKEKGINFAISALSEAIKSNPKLHLLIVGEGEELGNLTQQVTNLSLNAHVTFAGRRNDIADLLQCADIFVLPSLNEGLPMAMLEAMASSKSIIASDVGDVSSALSGDAGIVIEPKNIQALTSQILALASQQITRDKLGTKALERVNENYSSGMMAKCYSDLYSRVLLEDKEHIAA